MESHYFKQQCLLALSLASLPFIMTCSIIFCGSSRMVGLVQLLLKSNAANCLVEDYAACLELRSEESQIIENSSNDPGVLIMQVLLFFWFYFI